MAQHLARALRRSTVPTDGINLLLADGAAAGQEVFHCHLHVIPRTARDGLVIDAPFVSPPRSEARRPRRGHQVGPGPAVT
ncbi:MAG: HIT family protein [Dermatophilaceae bacterium]